MAISYNGDICVVLEFQHRTPGKYLRNCRYPGGGRQGWVATGGSRDRPEDAADHPRIGYQPSKIVRVCSSIELQTCREIVRTCSRRRRFGPALSAPGACSARHAHIAS